MTINEYKALRIISIAFKVLAGFALLFTLLVTFVNIIQNPNMGPQTHPNPIIAFFNTLFPILFGLFQSLFLYASSELILLLIDMKDNLEDINHKL
ncbi:hypothetical protein [Halanaerobaculum tunisiense]